MKKLILLLLLSNLSKSFAQNFTFQYNNTLKVIQNGQTLTNAFAGGLNAPQFSKCHLDNDNIEDLVVFDRTNSKITTFLARKDNAGKDFWQYAPEFESVFPSIQHWMLLVDYDSDGKKDIFTYTPAGIKVYRNISTDKIAWQLITDPLYSTGYSGRINLYTASTDIPAIVDVDNDGDLDIVAFDSSGNFFLFHKNFSQENHKDNTHLEFKRIGDCWGDVFKENFDDARFGQDCGSNSPVGGNGNPSSQKVEHSGNAVLVLDLDGDGLKDVLYGHIADNRVAALSNNGSLSKTIFTKADYFFPNQKPIDFSVFPAIYYEDLDFDGIKDIIAAPNGYDNALQTVDYQNSAWFYKNSGQNNKPILNYQQSNFLQNTMVELGENTSPVLVDIDGDGDLDLLVGNAGNTSNNSYRASISLFENKGNNTFELKTADFLDLSKAQQLFEIKPFVTDINGDGTEDFGYTANTSNGMTIQYIPNRAPRNQAFSLKLSEIVTLPKINNLSNGDSPLFFDLDNDGKKDLLIGKGSGRIEFHKNNGSNQNPNYVLTKEELGGLTSDYLSGNVSLATADLNGDGKAELITGNRDGTFKVYKNIIDQSQNLFKEDSSGVLNDLTGKHEHLKLGGMLSITVGDLDGDVIPDFIVGTNSGGLRFLKGTTKFIVTGNEESKSALIYPNPANHYIYIKNTYPAEYHLIDFSGKDLGRKTSTNLNEEVYFDLSTYPNGTYFVRIMAEGKAPITEKVLLNK